MNEIRTYSSSQARAQWRDVLDLAAGGTDVVIERHGKPMVAVIAYNDYVALKDELENCQNELYYQKRIVEMERGQQ